MSASSSKGVHKLASGRFRLRISVNGRLVSLDLCDTMEKATAVRAAALAKLQDSPAPTTSASSLRSCEEAFFAARARAGIRSLRDERSRWNRNVATAPFFDWPAKAIRPHDVRSWLDSLANRCVDPPHAPNRKAGPTKRRRRGSAWKKVSRSTVANSKNVLSACLQWLIDKVVLQENVARRARSPHRRVVDIRRARGAGSVSSHAPRSPKRTGC